MKQEVLEQGALPLGIPAWRTIRYFAKNRRAGCAGLWGGKNWLLLLAFACIPSGAQVRFEAPRVGYVFDLEAKAIRDVSGVPGAASFAEARSTGEAIERAWISAQGFALVQNKQESEGARFVRIASGESREFANFEAAAISNSGRFFAVATSGGIEIWDGAALTRTGRFDAGAQVRGLAVSDDGRMALAATATGLMAWNGRNAEQVWSGGALAEPAFFGSSNDYAVLDAEAGKILVSRGGSATTMDSPVAGAYALATSGDSRLVLASETSIGVADLASNARATVATEDPAARFSRVGTSGEVFQVQFRNSTKTALLELGMAAPQIEILSGGVR